MSLWRYRATVVRVIDADSIVVDADQGFSVFTRQTLRLARIDAWETRGEERPEGLKAKAYVEGLLPVGAPIEITTTHPGKYGRYIAEVLIPDASPEGFFNLNDRLLAEGHATPYGD